MARVKRAVNAQKKRRTTLERASGYRGQRSRLYRKAKEQARADRKAAEDAEREAAHAAGPVAQKKERRRSENLDPEIEA